MEEAKKKIEQLIAKYEEIKANGAIKKQSEEQTKKDFILPLFEALGWDVYSKDKAEVTAEDKSPANELIMDFISTVLPNFILKQSRYRHSQRGIRRTSYQIFLEQGCTWAVLTDFETLIVFNALSPEKSLHGKKFLRFPIKNIFLVLTNSGFCPKNHF